MTYWDSTGRHQKLAEELRKLIPAAGPVENARKNPKLERFRKVANAYYDLFNNGGGNRKQACRAYFGVDRYGVSARLHVRWSDYKAAFQLTEPVLDNAILDAALEQGLISLAHAYMLRIAA